MTTLDSMNAMLHDPEKRRPILRRAEMLLAIGIMSGSWIAAGYALGRHSNDERVEKLQASYALKLEALRDQQGKKLEALREQCAKKEIAK